MSTEQIFEKFDKNKDGKLSLEELREAALAFFNTFTEEEIQFMFYTMDVDNDGQVEAAEFTSCIETLLKDVFDCYDVDGVGKISADDLYVTMPEVRRECTEESLAEKVRIADANGDGYLNYGEFRGMILSDVLGPTTKKKKKFPVLRRKLGEIKSEFLSC